MQAVLAWGIGNVCIGTAGWQSLPVWCDPILEGEVIMYVPRETRLKRNQARDHKYTATDPDLQGD